MISIIYVISVLILFTLATIVRKKEDKMDFITTFFVEIVVFSCFNIISCLLLKIINLNTTLLRLIIINIIVSLPIIYKLIKDKQLQKYYFEKRDIIGLGIIIIVGLLMIYINFGWPINISYFCTDSANHYKCALDFCNNGIIKIADLCGAYINYGIFFKVFYNPVNKFGGVFLFVLLETLKLLFSGILIYLTIKQFSKTKLSFAIGIIISIIYMIAYPLNGTLCGFVYLQFAVNIISAIFVIMVNYNSINNKLKNSLLFLLMCGLVFNYYFLAPPIALAIIIYELKNIKKNKWSTIANIVKILAIPTIAGVLFYFILPYITKFNITYNPASHIINKSSQTAYTFVSYYAMFIFFLPFCIYNIVDNIRKKEIDFLSVAFAINTLYIIAIVVAQFFDRIARYYVMKPYFVQWLIMLTITGEIVLKKLSEKIENTYKFLITTVIVFYTLGILYSALVKGPCSSKVFDKEKEGIQSIFNIYRVNRSIMLHESFDTIWTSNELNVLKDITKNFNNDTKIFYVQDDIDRMWLKDILQINKENILAGYPPRNPRKQNEIIDMIKNSDERVYIICHKILIIDYYFDDLLEKVDNNFKQIANVDNLTIYVNK